MTINIYIIIVFCMFSQLVLAGGENITHIIKRKSIIEPIHVSQKYSGVTIPSANKDQFINKCLNSLEGVNFDYQQDCENNYGDFHRSGKVVNSLRLAVVSCSLECFVPKIPVGKCTIERIHVANSNEKLDFFRLTHIESHKGTALKKNGKKVYLSKNMSEVGYIKELMNLSSSCDSMAHLCFPDQICNKQ